MAPAQVRQITPASGLDQIERTIIVGHRALPWIGHILQIEVRRVVKQRLDAAICRREVAQIRNVAAVQAQHLIEPTEVRQLQSPDLVASQVVSAPCGAAHGKLGGRSTDLCRTDSGRRGDNANRETFAGSQ